MIVTISSPVLHKIIIRVGYTDVTRMRAEDLFPSTTRVRPGAPTGRKEGNKRGNDPNYTRDAPYSNIVRYNNNFIFV